MIEVRYFCPSDQLVLEIFKFYTPRSWIFSLLISKILSKFVEISIFLETPFGKYAWFLLYNPLWIDSCVWWNYWIFQERKLSFTGWRFGYWFFTYISWLLESPSISQAQKLLLCFDSWNRYSHVISLNAYSSYICLLLWYISSTFWLLSSILVVVRPACILPSVYVVVVVLLFAGIEEIQKI